jgi:hypothetical protein
MNSGPIVPERACVLRCAGTCGMVSEPTPQLQPSQLSYAPTHRIAPNLEVTWARCSKVARIAAAAAAAVAVQQDVVAHSHIC